jgi:hypothetical protein
MMLSADPATYKKGAKLYEKWKKENGPPRYVGELPSQPLTVFEFPQWLEKYYPPRHNKTCGMHVHMSFKSAFVYQCLMVPEYERTVVEFLFAWATKNLPPGHHIFERLAGQNDYCRTGRFMADDQVKATRKGYERNAPVNRYTAIHYAWGMHRTIEWRDQ